MQSVRRKILKSMLALGVLPALSMTNVAAEKAIIMKPVPRTGEQLPVIGLGTSRVFDVDVDETETSRRLSEVLSIFFAEGGQVIDSSPMYGLAEESLGQLLRLLEDDQKLFAATKVWTDGEQRGKSQMHQSLEYWGHADARFDLMQIHNLRDWQTHLDTLIEWKQQGRIRYIGITTYAGHDHDELADILQQRDEFDFVQLSYNVLNRKAEQTLFPVIHDKQIAVLANRPFQRGDLFRMVRGKPLPEWASEWGMSSWAQVFLKYTVSHPQVTCAIPGTSKPRHMRDNMMAQRGVLPDGDARQTIEQYFEKLV